MEINLTTVSFSFRKKLLLQMMRITLFLCCLTAFGFTPNTILSQNAEVTIERNKKLTVDEVFDLIMKQTDYNFVYQEGLFDSFPKVKLKKGVVKANDLLKQSLSSDDFNFEFSNSKTIVIKKNPASEEVLKQQRQLQGLILDEKGFPLVGVTVVVEGTQRGVVSDFNGIYKIKLNEGETVVVFSSLGYETLRKTVTDQMTLDVVMKEDFSQLDEIVLIGYGEQKREDVTTAIGSVDSKKVVQAATGSVGFDRALGGLVQGVQVSQNTGRPGAEMNINIRGYTSPLGNNTNQPLFVIDGVPFNIDGLPGANPLLTLNPNDIESFDVLKDAGATAIYGSRGANGVIIISTKKGKRNQAPNVNLSYTTTLATPINTVDVLNASQYRDFYGTLISNTVNSMNAGQYGEGLLLAFAPDLDNIGNVEINYMDYPFQVDYNGLRDDYFGTANTDWNKEIFRSLAVTKQANLSVHGGSEKTNYAFSTSFIDQEGLTIKDGLKQYTLSTSLDTDISSRIKIGGKVNVGHSQANSGENDVIDSYTVNTSVVRARPDLPIYDENGALLAQQDFAYGFAETFEPNPLMRLQNKNTTKTYNFIGNGYIEFEPIKDLTLKADINAAVFSTENSQFIPKITQTEAFFIPRESYLSESSNLTSNITTNLTANYAFRFSEHKFNVLAGAAWDRTNFNNKSQFYSGFPDDEVLINATSAENALSYSSTRVETGLNSLFSRLTYNYNNRYNITLNFRTDVSSKFGPENQRAYFPSASAGWNIANEDFLSESETINTLRLRASAGRVGSTNVADFAYLQFFQTTAGNAYVGSSAVLPNDTFPNNNIGWEETDEVNFGLDFAFFNSRLRGGIDVYNRKTTGALASTPIPLELGQNIYFSNLIDVSNKGVEIAVGGDIFRTEDFTWSANINWSFNRNKLDKLNGTTLNDYLLDFYIEGEPVGTIKGYKVVKVFQSQDEVDALNAAAPEGQYDQLSTSVGDYMYEDVNGDGEITSDDKAIIGDIQPDFYGGISNTFTYKNLSLTALMQYSVGAEAIWRGIPFGTFNQLGENKYSEYALNTWTPENPDARYARALYFDPSSSGRTSDRYLYDTSYLRLKSLQLSYSFDQNVMDKIGFDSARVMLTGSNLITWTKWPGIDPESFSERGTIVSQTTNEDPYPLSKSISLGVQVQF